MANNFRSTKKSNNSLENGNCSDNDTDLDSNQKLKLWPASYFPWERIFIMIINRDAH